MHKVTFFGFDCIVVKGTYRANQQVALSLIADDTSNNLDQGVSTGEPIATATLCLKGESSKYVSRHGSRLMHTH